MSRVRRPDRRWSQAALSAAAVGVLLGYAATVICQEPRDGSEISTPAPLAKDAPPAEQEPAAADAFKLVFPPHQSVLVDGDFDVICKAAGGPLEADGEAHEWEAIEPPLYVAHMNLWSGRNKLRIGPHEVEIYVTRNGNSPDGPDGWPLVHRHPIDGRGAKRCGKCHEAVENGSLTRLGELKSYQACFQCHKAVEFEVTHSHPLEPIEHCHMCHRLHGSTRKALLKAPTKKLCADCHDA